MIIDIIDDLPSIVIRISLGNEIVYTGQCS